MLEQLVACRENRFHICTLYAGVIYYKIFIIVNCLPSILQLDYLYLCLLLLQLFYKQTNNRFNQFDFILLASFLCPLLPQKLHQSFI